MKKFISITKKCAFSIVPVFALALVINSHQSKTQATNLATAHLGNSDFYYFSGLPCGFVSKGVVSPGGSSFTANNSIPILQYPAGYYIPTTIIVPDAIYSANGADKLVMQSDGNLVIYCETCVPEKALWSTQTNNGKFLVFQTDGNLIVKDSSHNDIWASNIVSTCAGSQYAYFSLQNDGNLVMKYDDNAPNLPSSTTWTLGSTNSAVQARSPYQGVIQ